jgi:signal transduction histidine kinase
VIGLSRDLVDSLNDIVWAINPNRDSLDDLTHRMRRFASDLASARGVELRFRTPGVESDLKLGADLRRETFLIFKESVNNAVRHAACTEIDVQLAVSNRWIELSVRDNGKGFEEAGKEGNGLASMYRRASQLGGVLKVTSGPGLGTAVSLRAPAEPGRGF